MLNIISEPLKTLAPLSGNIANFKFGNITVAEIIRNCFRKYPDVTISVRDNFIPSPELTERLAGKMPVKIVSPFDNVVLARNSEHAVMEINPDENSFLIRYPWDLLSLNEHLLAEIGSDIRGIVKERVAIDGIIQLGEGSVILPGVYIEGNVIIGRNCKIGPNCYIRGNTSIGDFCHIGQAVEIKNSIIADHVSIGHLSYAGDSIIASNVNFGAGTIISNLRHDGKNHTYIQNGCCIPTGRRKFGAVIGENVHTGIHTSVYPGRTLSPNSSTLPGEIVKYSK